MCVSKCGRCGGYGYEQLRTHGYCGNCNYSDDLANDDEAGATLAWACKLVDNEEKRERSKIVSLPLHRKTQDEDFQSNLKTESSGVL
jgi:hypothetical protein